MIPSPPIFSPDEAQTRALISSFADPERTLLDIADDADTTIEALTIWMARPDIAERINALHTAATARVRLIATNFLPSAIQTLVTIIDDYTYDRAHTPRRPASDVDEATRRERRRASENARRAINLLTRLARLQSPSQIERPRVDSAPRQSAPTSPLSAHASPNPELSEGQPNPHHPDAFAPPLPIHPQPPRATPSKPRALAQTFTFSHPHIDQDQIDRPREEPQTRTSTPPHRPAGALPEPVGLAGP